MIGQVVKIHYCHDKSNTGLIGPNAGAYPGFSSASIQLEIAKLATNKAQTVSLQ